MTATGSRPSSSGHFAHRGRPARSREATGRFSPQAAHGSSRPHAGRAVPVLAAALEAPDLPAAPGAGRQRDVPGAGVMQGDEQVRDGPGRRGPAVGEHCGPPGQGNGEAA